MKFPAPPQPRGMKISLEPVLPLWLDLAQLGTVIGLGVIGGFTLFAYLKF